MAVMDRVERTAHDADASHLIKRPLKERAPSWANMVPVHLAGVRVLSRYDFSSRPLPRPAPRPLLAYIRASRGSLGPGSVAQAHRLRHPAEADEQLVQRTSPAT